MIDELAYAAKMDPVAFRLQNMTDHRWITRSIQTAAQARQLAAAGGGVEPLERTVVTGRGSGSAQPAVAASAAVIAEIEVNKKTGKITVKHMYSALRTPGLAINPAWSRTR